jgi:two-component sensor histidine kinase
VHHRVKNNLQVVASLLNLHARGATSEDASAAYASIQRRVDALAVVHRNHYAELEENRGVALKSLLSELGANLRANAPKSASGLQIRLAVDHVHASQDVAVPVAFLVTELVEFAMFCDARCVTVTVEQAGPGKASLVVESDALQGAPRCDERLFERFDRIVTGLSRQLRSVIQKDSEAGRYALEIAIVGRGD